MFDIIIGIIGMAASALYVGFMAYSIHSVPLWVVVIVALALMLLAFSIEFRGNGNAKDRKNRGG
jgi:uncharacterized membrane protein YoaK (UPF0700 family)